MEEHHQIRVEIFSVVIIVQPASSCFQSTVDLICVPMLIIQNILVPGPRSPPMLYFGKATVQ